ncbi:MAG TPA: flagellum-specific ATP synthase FliI, partial [Stellaceae bacterium]|nr:flagellum-specific ATP synthase FliI [Stellaceae bacterium]
ISSLCERAGNGAEGSGSITAFYTVLVEGDDPNDPVGDSARSILDGHLVLSRRIADRGQFPAIDVAASVSRVMSAVMPPELLTAAQQFKQLYNRLEESRDLLAIGGYRPGHDAELDRAVSLQPTINAFLCQDMTNAVRFGESVAALGQIVN